MDIKQRALELLGMSGISEEERMRRSLEEANRQPEQPMNPENPSFFQKLKDLYNPQEEPTTGPGVRLNPDKVKKFKGQ